MPFLGLHVQPHVVVADLVEREHGDVAEDDLAVLRGRAGGGEGAAMLALVGLGLGVRGIGEDLAFQPGAGGLQGAVERVGFQLGIRGGDVDEVDGAAFELRPWRGGAVGDPLHLFEVFGVITSQEHGVDQASRPVPGGHGIFRAAKLRERRDVIGDLAREQVAMLIAALVGLALDVQDDPAGLRVAIGGAESLDRRRVGREIGDDLGRVAARAAGAIHPIMTAARIIVAERRPGMPAPRRCGRERETGSSRPRL